MTKILGLDLGTNSIVWAIIDDAEKRIILDTINFNYYEKNTFNKVYHIVLSNCSFDYNKFPRRIQ
jgi:CRISPR/Cas system Type II protein with McrA/HNH and RuvC-like nuclease domain